MRDIIKQLNGLLTGRQKRKLLGLFFMMLLGALLEMLGVSLIIPMVAAITNAGYIMQNAAVAAICKYLNITDASTLLLLCMILLAAIYIAKNLYLLFLHQVQSRFIFNNELQMASRLFDCLLGRPYEYFLQTATSSVIRLVGTDIQNVFQILSHTLQIATEGIISIGLFFMLLFIDPAITLYAACLLFTTSLFVSKVLKPKIRLAGQSARQSQVKKNQWLLQAINGIKEVIAGNKEPFFLRYFEQYGKEQAHSARQRNVLNVMPRLLIETVCVVGLLGFLALRIYGGNDIFAILPQLAALVVAAVRMMPSANRINTALVNISYLEPSLQNLCAMMKEMSAESSAGNDQSDASEPALTLQSHIELKNISYQYPAAHTAVFTNANMTIPANACIGIVGRSGAGKTTLVDILLGLLRPQEGEVLSDGIPVGANQKDWFQKIGYIPQPVFLLDGSVRDNVVFGSAQKDDARIWEALEQAQLKEYFLSFKEGLELQVGEKGCRLSGGQKQRIGIARALYKKPELLIFDEATSSLDQETEAEVFKAVHALRGKVTMVIISHRQDAVKNCDAVYKVGDGQVAAQAILRQRDDEK